VKVLEQPRAFAQADQQVREQVAQMEKQAEAELAQSNASTLVEPAG